MEAANVISIAEIDVKDNIINMFLSSLQNFDKISMALKLIPAVHAMQYESIMAALALHEFV